MVAILQTAFWNAHSWLKMFRISLNFCFWCLDWKQTGIGSDNGLAPNGRQAIIWTNNGIFNSRIYALLGPNELTNKQS